jgi:hypothetical protein
MLSGKSGGYIGRWAGKVSDVPPAAAFCDPLTNKPSSHLRPDLAAPAYLRVIELKDGESCEEVSNLRMMAVLNDRET